MILPTMERPGSLFGNVTENTRLRMTRYEGDTAFKIYFTILPQASGDFCDNIPVLDRVTGIQKLVEPKVVKLTVAPVDDICSVKITSPQL